MWDAYTFYRNMQEDGIIFSFTGPTSQSVVEGIGEVLRRKMALEETKMSVSLKVFSIFVEQMQNVLNYSAEKEPPKVEDDNELHYGMVTVGKKDGHFYILSGNYITKQDTERFCSLLDRVIAMDKDQLKPLNPLPPSAWMRKRGFSKSPVNLIRKMLPISIRRSLNGSISFLVK